MTDEVFRESLIRQYVIDEWQFDPLTIHCLITGKPLGNLDFEEFDSVCRQLPGSIEEAGDDLAIRALATMRPSMRWNRQRIETLNELRQVAPVEVMAFLLNRLFEPSAEDKSWGDFATQHVNKIKLYRALALADKADSWNAVLLWLLDLEGKLGLRSEKSPFKCEALFDSEHFIENLQFLIEPWYHKRLQHFFQAEREAKFFAANPGARLAARSQFMTVAPKSESRIKAEVKQQGRNYMDAILAELLGDAERKPAQVRVEAQEAIEAVRSAKIVVPSTKMPAWLKKESHSG